MKELVESPVTLFADTVIGDKVGAMSFSSEPALCVVAGTIAATVALGAAVVVEDAAAAAILTAAAVGVAGAGAAVGAGNSGVGSSPGDGTSVGSS